MIGRPCNSEENGIEMMVMMLRMMTMTMTTTKQCREASGSLEARRVRAGGF